MKKTGKYCQKCNTELKRHDVVKRYVRGKNKTIKCLLIERYQCPHCHTIHREIPSTVYLYKQYEAEIIDGVREGLIDSSTLGFEDYPSEMTMKRWRKEQSEDGE